MSFMLPSPPEESVSLADVVPSCLVSLGWNPEPARIPLERRHSIILFVVDGLGSSNLNDARAYLRFVASGEPLASDVRTVFPSTTASALSTLVTGTRPEVHGITGYRVWDTRTESFVNQLNGLTLSDVDAGWMRAPSLLTVAAEKGNPVFVVGHPRFESSALTRMLYRGCTYVVARSVEDKVSAVLNLMMNGRRGLFLVYVSDLDEAAHAVGVNSTVWTDRAEELDGQVRRCVAQCATDVLILLTADHGVVDISSSGHIDFGLGAEMEGVLAVGGEPRCLQLKLEVGVSVDLVATKWRENYGNVAEVYAPRSSSTDVTDRLPDLYVEAKQGFVFYDGREPDSAARNMVGQHGGRTLTEAAIPLLAWNL